MIDKIFGISGGEFITLDYLPTDGKDCVLSDEVFDRAQYLFLYYRQRGKEYDGIIVQYRDNSIVVFSKLQLQ